MKNKKNKKKRRKTYVSLQKKPKITDKRNIIKKSKRINMSRRQNKRIKKKDMRALKRNQTIQIRETEPTTTTENSKEHNKENERQRKRERARQKHDGLRTN